MLESPSEGRLPTKLRQKLERRSENNEVTSSTGNIHNEPSCTMRPNSALGLGTVGNTHDSLPLCAPVPIYPSLRPSAHLPAHGLFASNPGPCLPSRSPSAFLPPPPAPASFCQPPPPSPSCSQQLPANSSFTQPERATVDELMAMSGTSGGHDRVGRRLAQNREAARKCRQKKKAYLSQLEAQVQALKQVHPRDAALLAAAGEFSLASMQATSAPSGSSSDPCCSAEEKLGHLRGLLDALVAEGLQLRDALAAGMPDEELRAMRERAMDAMKRLKRAKEKVLGTAGLLMLMTGEHLHPPQRVMLWMGGLRPTEGLGLVREELQAQNLAPAMLERFQRIMEDCYQQEEALGRAYTVLKSDVLSHMSHHGWLRAQPQRHAAQVPALHSLARAAAGEVALSPQLLGKMSAMRVLLAEAADLRMSVLAQLREVLTLRQFALVLARPLELLHTLNCTAAALQQLQLEGRLCL